MFANNGVFSDVGMFLNKCPIYTAKINHVMRPIMKLITVVSQYGRM